MNSPRVTSHSQREIQIGTQGLGPTVRLSEEQRMDRKRVGIDPADWMGSIVPCSRSRALDPQDQYYGAITRWK
jgi:hypothetical protein